MIPSRSSATGRGPIFDHQPRGNPSDRKTLACNPASHPAIVYRTAHDAVRVEVVDESETFRRNRRRIADLFDADVRTVSEQLRSIYAGGEFAAEATLRKIRMVRMKGEREGGRDIFFYHLDAGIFVGYRVHGP